MGRRSPKHRIPHAKQKRVKFFFFIRPVCPAFFTRPRNPPAARSDCCGHSPRFARCMPAHPPCSLFLHAHTAGVQYFFV
ncbi:hypothetical protein DRA42_08155 [Ethanoligenens harbinense]|nr:hypothetical protein CXQ68_08125 [Ethanoligenens harbinense YUAN-3]AYF38854.1 hypothetical protein CXP51_07995 [Ethanoligenens harbinense]AYF41604.1 hypothetical protein CN246_08140 [Ethanoligenens harbinense]QCN92435.1 hypothetical protein DRA42_08155 [Ethanoligenens harbinense]